MTHAPFDPDDVDLAWLSGLATALVGDAQAGDDIAQDAVIAALARPGAIERPRAWLAGTVRRLAARRVRSESRRRRREAAAARSESMPDASELLARAETAEAVLAAARRLAEPFRRTVYLRFLEGLTPDEIARREGRPADTVRARLRRGLKLLRADLVRRGRAGSSGPTDWSAWCALLIPLTRSPLGGPGAVAVGSTVVDSTSTALSVLTMKTKVLAAGIGAVALVWGLWAFSNSRASAKLDPSHRAPTLGASAAASAPGDAPLGNAPVEPDRDRPVVRARTPNPGAAEPVARPATIAGRVVDRDGKPIPGARVFLRPMPFEAAEGDPLSLGETGDDGSFSLPCTRPLEEALELGATAEGYLRGFVTASAGGAEAILVLERGRELRGVVLDPSGVGVAGLELLIHDVGAGVGHVSPSQVSLRASRQGLSSSGTGYEDERVRTDERGRFNASGLPAGALGVQSLDPSWTFADRAGVDPAVRYVELRAQPSLGVRLTLEGAEDQVLRAKFRVEVRFEDGETKDYEQWVGRGLGWVSFALTPGLLPPDERRAIAAARFHGEVRIGDGQPTAWEAPVVSRGVAEVRVTPDPRPRSLGKGVPEPLPRVTVDLDVRFDDGTAVTGPINVAWRHARGDRDDARANVVSAGRYRCELPVGTVELAVSEGSASGSLAPWTGRVQVGPRIPVQLVTLRRGATARIPRPPQWTGGWSVHASWRPSADQPWRGSWNYGTEAPDLTLRALSLVEWRFELTSPTAAEPIVRTANLRQAGELRVVDR